MSDVIVIGGGLAGLASSVALSQAGMRVTLLESRPRLGGRASSFEDSTTGELIDNCQHVAMGCCTNFRHFCRVTGIEASFRREPELFFVAPPTATTNQRPDVCRFSAMPLPAPLHLAAAFLRLCYLTWREKLALARGLKALARERAEAARHKNFADWLAEQRQPANVIERFWWVLGQFAERIARSRFRRRGAKGFRRRVSRPSTRLGSLATDRAAR